MKYLFVLGVLLMSLTSPAAHAALVTKEIRYQDGPTALTGYLAYDESIKSPAPGVLVVHEWWGHNDYVRQRAEQLASLGYIAFALDMYGTSVKGESPDEASKLAEPFYNDRDLMRRRALAGLDVLRSQPNVDVKNLGIIGYCFGGTVALELARAGTDLKGVVSFHGGLATPKPAAPAMVKAQVLALNGGADPFVPQEEKNSFIKEMTAAGVTFRSIDYPGVKHAFTNPAATATGEKYNIPVAYDETADKASWEEMRQFFQLLFKK